MFVPSLKNYTYLEPALKAQSSEKMLNYPVFPEILRDETELAAPVLSAAEKEQQLNAVNNCVKTATLLNGNNKNKIHVMERVASSSDLREASAMIQNFNTNFPDTVQCSGSRSAYDIIPVVDYVAIQEFKGGIQYDYGPTGKRVYNDDRVLTTIEGDESTFDNPVMYTMSKDRNTGEFVWYKISINQVDPGHATREEMYAYITYTTKDDFNAYSHAMSTFRAIEELGVELGLITENQVYMNYVDLFKTAAEDHKNLLKTTNLTPMPGVRDVNKEYYDELLEMLDKMIEHSYKAIARQELVGHQEIEQKQSRYTVISDFS